MEFKYEALDNQGKPQSGTINAASQDLAIDGLQRRGLTITSISGGDDKKGLQSMLSGNLNISLFERVSGRDIVLLSREISTLFEAQVSALRVFRLLADQPSWKPGMRKILVEVSDDLQSGNSISKALAKHPRVFSDFYVNMVHAGEESGKLDQTFLFLADYTERSYELTSKARNALVYPAFIIVTFIAVMVLMMTLVIPKITAILEESGQELPLQTKIVIGLSDFLLDYGIFLLIALIIGGYFVYRYIQTPAGAMAFNRVKLAIPYVGNLYQKLYLARIADNMHVMLSSGISAVRSIEITASVVDNEVYKGILQETLDGVKSGVPMSQTLNKYPKEISGIMVQMFQIGEETGELGNILQRMSKFYAREVNAAVDTLVSLIEPALIVSLALGVGILLSAILLPIYNSVTAI